jgi:hypothetical protein
MRDGAVLRADRYVPEGRGDAPVVLMRTPYGRWRLWKRLYCRPFAQRGYQVVIQSCRGTEDSSGEFVPFDERDDGADTLAWLRERPWYPGQFATFGPSYWGLSQWALADGVPYDLVAMVPSLTSSRLARSMFFGGAFSLEGWLAWSAVIAAQENRGPGIGAVTRARSRKVAKALRHLPLNQADEAATGRTLGWWQHLVVGHCGWPHEHPKMLQLYMREALAWLDAHVRDDSSGPHGGPVRYFVTGIDEWRDAPTWPPPGTVDQPWYLQPAGKLSTTEPDASEPSRYRYDPADPTPVAGGPSARRNARVPQKKVEQRPDVLTFTSAALTGGSRRPAPSDRASALQRGAHRRRRSPV